MRKFTADQVVFVDESGVDKRTGRRRTGWAPIGKASKIKHPLGRGQRYQLLPALAVDGVVDCYIYNGSTNVEGFAAWFIERLLPKCHLYPQARSVLVMDNASFHYNPKISTACRERGIKLVYLPLYSTDFNPI